MEKYQLAWKDDRRGDCVIELWKEGNWWRWFYRPADIRFYKQGSGNVGLRGMKKYLRDEFCVPHSVKFRLNVIRTHYYWNCTNIKNGNSNLSTSWKNVDCPNCLITGGKISAFATSGS
jgi:hypothetical protein